MKNKKKLILLGGGGHCKSIIDTLKLLDDWSDIKIIDSKIEIGTFVNEIEVIGNNEVLLELFKKGYKYAFVAMGSVGNTVPRKTLYGLLKSIGFIIPSIIDKTSYISSYSTIDEGTFIGKNTVINANVKIGKCVIINTGSIIEHDCEIDNFVHIAPGSVLSGSVKVGSDTHIGTNSTIKNNVIIGKNTIIGVGSVVVNDINSDIIAYGNPCKEVKK
jgi:sugar O-acyltransferase (sialic acid O-acetyltransferase NeuD family)